MENKKLGLLLGSFDPIHIGHIYMATQALNLKLVDDVLFIPAFQNPWKENSTSFWTRCHMVDLALSDLEHCDKSTIESELNPPYYSYNTLIKIKEYYSEYDLYLIVGEDIISEIQNWYRGDWILENFKLIVVSRPNCEYNNKVDIPKTINISSTEIRNMYKEGKQVYPLVPKIVNDYIKQYKIYE